MEKSDTLVRFYENVDPSLLKYAVIVARCRGKWVLCRHRDRKTWEVPGGHREPGEEIGHAARRELFEETGALRYALTRVCVYSVTGAVNGGKELFGMLYFAEIGEFGPLPKFEMAEIALRDDFPDPDSLTYPEIQPELFRRAQKLIEEK
ncbi:NUDIX domain-containing protein [Caproiciproducens sp. NJN-50]|uniref:NUDIX hydrolase n=1 Tax=Acutalibacteraceae TaxID=3082771 RepID=UPI000FFDF9F1|nr:MULTISPECIES: NUDIX domain-containing protein [Acutalibacteraceae]QAT51146.1 NUDIX domain-containing protein [Caproiciproducens sp. NJN-50]